MVKNYKDLIVWQKSMTFVTTIYRLTQSFPNDERFGLTNQLRRAAVSVPSNIAEGHARQSDPEFARFLAIANGSLAEVDTQMAIASNLGFISDETSQQAALQTDEIARMIQSLRSTVINHPHTQTTDSPSATD